MYVAVPLKNCPLCSEKQTVLYAMRARHEVAFTSYCVRIIDLHTYYSTLSQCSHMESKVKKINVL